MWYVVALFVGYAFFPISIVLMKRLARELSFWFKLQSYKTGVYVEDVGRWSYFYPRTPKAQIAARDVCQGKYSRTWIGRGWKIPYDDRREVYEGLARHRLFPQEVTTGSSKLTPINRKTA